MMCASFNAGVSYQANLAVKNNVLAVSVHKIANAKIDIGNTFMFIFDREITRSIFRSIHFQKNIPVVINIIK